MVVDVEVGFTFTKNSLECCMCHDSLMNPTCFTFPHNLLQPILGVMDVDWANSNVRVERSLLNRTAQPALWEMWKRFVKESCWRYWIASCNGWARSKMCFRIQACSSPSAPLNRKRPRTTRPWRRPHQAQLDDLGRRWASTRSSMSWSRRIATLTLGEGSISRVGPFSTNSTSWRSDGSPSCLVESSHPVGPARSPTVHWRPYAGRPWVAHKTHTRHKEFMAHTWLSTCLRSPQRPTHELAGDDPRTVTTRPLPERAWSGRWWCARRQEWPRRRHGRSGERVWEWDRGKPRLGCKRWVLWRLRPDGRPRWPTSTDNERSSFKLHETGRSSQLSEQSHAVQIRPRCQDDVQGWRARPRRSRPGTRSGRQAMRLVSCLAEETGAGCPAQEESWSVTGIRWLRRARRERRKLSADTSATVSSLSWQRTSFHWPARWSRRLSSTRWEATISDTMPIRQRRCQEQNKLQARWGAKSLLQRW